MDAFADPVNAFVPHGRLIRSEGGTGLRVAVKDLFDWKGVPTGAGNPDWLATHPVPTEDAAVLTALLQAGFILHGKTVTDELAYSIHGDNEHYGTPQNSAAPGRVPGGSSSGSAAAVAAGLVDVGLGTDTGGSIRVPAAYCGLFGLRTTHGAVDRSGLVALAPSFDTVGWLGRSASMLAELGRVLLPPSSTPTRVATLNLPGIADSETLAATARLARRLGTPFDLASLVQSYGGLDALRRVYVTIQGREAWQVHGHWIEARRPRFSRAVALRFQAASRVGEEDAASAREVLAQFRHELRSALGPDTVLVLPATEGPAPLLTEPPEAVDLIRQRTMGLTCLAGLAGLPQLTVPFLGGLPRGVGLLGPAGSDLGLIALAEGLA